MLRPVGAEDKGRRVNVVLGVRNTRVGRGSTLKMRFTRRRVGVLNSKSDNTSDKKIITKDQYGVVWVAGCI